jgi:serine/threonine protein phosphatase PrpC
MPSTDSYHYGIASQRGQRADNEDSTGVHQLASGLIAIVADGLGGHRGGRVASNLAVQEFIARYLALSATHEPHDAALRALAEVNRMLHARGLSDPTLAHMGTTFTALILVDSVMHVLHVGDTRAYRLRSGRLERLTRDHNLADEGQPNILYRAIGTDADVEIDHAKHDARSGDRYLLCSDGVHGVLPDTLLVTLLKTDQDMQAGAARIVDAALCAGSTDNVTALTLELT